MFEVENVFRGVESKLQINEDVSIYIGQPREEFFINTFVIMIVIFMNHLVCE